MHSHSVTISFSALHPRGPPTRFSSTCRAPQPVGRAPPRLLNTEWAEWADLRKDLRRRPCRCRHHRPETPRLRSHSRAFTPDKIATARIRSTLLGRILTETKSTPASSARLRWRLRLPKRPTACTPGRSASSSNNSRWARIIEPAEWAQPDLFLIYFCPFLFLPVVELGSTNSTLRTLSSNQHHGQEIENVFGGLVKESNFDMVLETFPLFFSNSSSSFKRSFPAKILSPPRLLPQPLQLSGCQGRRRTPAPSAVPATWVACPAYRTGCRRTSSSEWPPSTTTRPTRKTSWPSRRVRPSTSWRRMMTGGGRGSWMAWPAFSRATTSKRPCKLAPKCLELLCVNNCNVLTSAKWGPDVIQTTWSSSLSRIYMPG